MNKFFFVSILLLVISCAPQGQNVNSVTNKTDRNNAFPTPASPMGGVDDGGGGSAVNGRPLESYAVNMLNRDEINQIILPVITKLSVQSPQIASEMFYTLVNKTWYIINAPLDVLPKEMTGTFFKTDQVAIQNRSDVWINEGLFEKMSFDDRALLILHELIMGVKILNFATPLEQCFAIAEEFEFKNNNVKFNEARSLCRKKYKLSPITDIVQIKETIKLSSEDYGMIRKLTISLIDINSIIFNKNLDIELVESGFRERH